MKHLYAISVVASRPGNTRHGAMALWAADEADAQAQGLQIILQGAPIHQGWTDHDVAVTRVFKDDATDLLVALMPNVSELLL